MELSDRARAKLDELSRSFFVVILLIVAVYLFAEAYAGDDWASIPMNLFVYSAVLISIRGTEGSQRLFNVHVAIIVPAFVLTVAGVLTDVGGLLGPGNFLTTVFAVTTLVMILRYVLTQRRVNSNVIFAAVSAYLLIGLLFGTVFSWMAYADPAAFQPPRNVETGDSSLFYYSFVTLTTLGFGDISPVTEGAKALTVIEALLGQVYLVVLIARLVAMHIARRQSERATVEAEQLRQEIREMLGRRS
ncbi:MAG: potassium channel family protein [Acidimicrobiia bacterium]